MENSFFKYYNLYTLKINYLNNFYFIYLINLIISNSIFAFGDWGLGIGDWAQSPIPNPQSPIPNPQSPLKKAKIEFDIIKFIK